ncbi:LolA-like protein [Arcicella rigui]|uniref:Outer membrane lipoprotein-sorting protein n=1 Tax=Arcicella rigui TaxID=797020 RepID=A0ABU5QC15_9BACT|nr:hypothetical protein [Arcicella rigui]MEA5140380.1 hypothetical protein [Arcicella rigui]
MIHKKYFILYFLLFVSSISQAQTAKEIYKKYMDAIGGEDNFKAINSLKIEENSKNFNAETDKSIRYKKRKDLFRAEYYEDSSTYGCSCYDGKFFWRLGKKSTKPKNVSRSQNEDKSWTIDDEAGGEPLFNSLIEYQSYGNTIHLEESIEEDDKAYFVIRVTLKKLSSTDFYINKATYLLDKTVEISQSGDKGVMTFISDYRQVGNLLLPHKRVSHLMGHIFSTTMVDNITLNPEISDELFKCERK